VFVAALIVAATGVALAARSEGEGEGRGERGPGIARMREEIGLSDQQVSELRALWTEQRKKAIRQRAETEVARVELRELIDALTPDEKAIAAKIKVVSDLQAVALRARVDGQLAMHKVLTAEQREKFRDRTVQRAGRRHRWGGRRGGLGREDGPQGRQPIDEPAR